jgi:hypothetical protein|tara:strand:+ start:195 stop:476 length:282 start_codon:yes stop_codon:yes gene_type:complete
MIKVKSIKTINLRDVCKSADDYGDDNGLGLVGELIWDEVRDRRHGEQVWCNDTYFVYWLPSLNGERLSSLQKEIVKLCGDAVVDHQIIFDVCW